MIARAGRGMLRRLVRSGSLAREGFTTLLARAGWRPGVGASAGRLDAAQLRVLLDVQAATEKRRRAR